MNKQQIDIKQSERQYPQYRTSAHCGRLRCEGCECLQFNQKFKTWRDRVRAYQPDPVWNPLRWVAAA